MITIDIVPAGPYRFGDPDPAPLVFGASGATGPIAWSVSDGLMTPDTGAESTLEPTNRTQTLTITATDTGTSDVATVEFEIEATFPLFGDYGMESDINPGFEVSLAEMGPPKFRVLPRSAQFPFVFKARLFTNDYAVARDFLVQHETFPFWVQIPELGELRKVYQDSALRRRADRINLIEYSFQARDYDYQVPANLADAGPFKPLDVPDWGEGDFGG